MAVGGNRNAFPLLHQFEDGARTHIRFACAWGALNRQYAPIKSNNGGDNFWNEFAYRVDYGALPTFAQKTRLRLGDEVQDSRVAAIIANDRINGAIDRGFDHISV